MPDDRSSWLLLRALKPAWHRTKARWGEIPPEAWRRWALALVAGYAFAWGVAYVVVRVGQRWAEDWMQAWDEQALRDFVASGRLSFPDAIWFEAWGSSAFLIPLLVAALFFLLRGGWLLRALTVVVAYFGLKGLVFGSWQLWNRARPDFVADGVATPPLHSYPSGHAVNSVVIFGLLASFWWRASGSWAERALIVLAVGAGYSMTSVARVRLGTHWPSDIVAGTVIGAAWLAGLLVALWLAERAAPAPERLERESRRYASSSGS
ncbi:MAG: phosphatase PAP2 family protein [Rhodothermales bacterium]|nr:phosphatase PAP2 family protein [Rhodothermales bacterium]